MQVLRLVIQHSCPLSDPVSSSRSARVSHLCHRGGEVILELRDSSPAELDSIAETYRGSGGIVELRSEDQESALVRFASCACCRSAKVISTMEASGYLFLPPSIYRPGGGEVYQFLGRGERIDPSVLTRLPLGVKVVQTGVLPLSSPEFEGGFLVPVGGLFQGVTARQRTAMVTAIRRGYYRIPRPVTTAELAHDLGVSREAFEALLRKAENKLLTALFPYLVLPEARPPESLPTAPAPVRASADPKGGATFASLPRGAPAPVGSSRTLPGRRGSAPPPIPAST